MFSQEEIERYNRHLILQEIGLEGQKNLKQAKVLVIGAGGLGCSVLQYLTAAGVGIIGICDFDFIDASNLQRQILYDISETGKSKALVAAEKLAKINPYTDFIVHRQMLSKENVLDIFKPFDIVVDCTDNFPTRFLINDACVILSKPLVFGAIYKFEGQVSVFSYMNGPTYRCLVPKEPANSEAPLCSQIGVMGVVPGLIGCYQAIEVIKMICGIGKVMSGMMLVVDMLNLAHTTIEIKRNEKSASIKELGNYGDFCINQYPDVKQINPNELYEQIKTGEFDIIDIRDTEIFNQYHIEGKNIPLADLFKRIEELSKEKKLVFLCENGYNSLAAVDHLLRTGHFKNLYNLKGGIQAWISSGLPYIC